MKGVVVDLNQTTFGALSNFFRQINPQIKTEIILKQENKIVSNQSDVCGILNDFYINIAKSIGIKEKTLLIIPILLYFKTTMT